MNYLKVFRFILAICVSGTACAGEADVVKVAEVPMQKTRDGRLIGAFPIDFLAWTADSSAIAGAASKQIAESADIKSGELWFEGSVSQTARAGLEAQGWTVKERVGLLLGEPMQAVEGGEGGAVSPAARGAATAVPK